MRIGMICYASFGGSGIVATELGTELAKRGHEVHFITSDVPVRMNRFRENLFFHRVDVDMYPLFTHASYSLNLAAKILDVLRSYGLDVLHSHYAVPHATSAYLAKEMCSGCPVRTVTTLHGTDITLVGVRPSFYEITRFSIARSDAVTAVSDWLRRKTEENFPNAGEIEVVRNFVDPERFRPRPEARQKRPWTRPGDFVLMHASNFRPVKNIPTILQVFRRLRERFPAHLVMVGDGPELPAAEEQARSLQLTDSVHFLGAQEQLEEVLPLADVFLLPSQHESFGLAALEAMSCDVAVVATSEGGTREIIRSGENGFVHAPKDVDGMVATIGRLFEDGRLRERVSAEGRRTAVEQFGVEGAVQQYLAVYEEALSR